MAAALEIDLGAGGGRITRSLVADWRARLASAGEARAVVLRSSAEPFCEGLDLRALDGDDAGVAAFGHWLDELGRDRRPVIAVVTGAAKGGGVGIAAAADWVIADERASFALPEVLLGLIPAVVFPHIARRVGVARARALAIGGDAVDAARAAEIGLVDELTSDVERALHKRLLRLSRMDGRAIATIKRLVAAHFGAPDGWHDDAVFGFASLLGSDATRARVRRLRDGLAPWDEDEHA